MYSALLKTKEINQAAGLFFSQDQQPVCQTGAKLEQFGFYIPDHNRLLYLFSTEPVKYYVWKYVKNNNNHNHNNTQSIANNNELLVLVANNK